MTQNNTNGTPNAPFYFKYYYQFSRDESFVLKHNEKYCLISFDDEPEENASYLINIYSVDGDLSWTNLFNLEIPEKCLVNKFDDLFELANSWKKNYIGSY